MISSAVIRFGTDCEKSPVLQLLADHPQIEIGELIGERSLPMILEASNSQDLEQLHAWIDSFPEVVFVDVVFVCFDSIANS